MFQPFLAKISYILHKHIWLVYRGADFPFTVNILKYIKF